MSELLDALLAKPQRETASSDTSSRFDYQKNWAFCQMLRRHMDGADYLVAFEFHDDVIFLDSSPSPSAAEFYQVKTSKSARPRKLADLTSQGSKKTNSILGKMFMNFNGMLSKCSLKVVLVSNVAFEFTDSDSSAADIAPKYRQKIVEKLRTELPEFVEEQIDSLHFIVTGVSIDAMQSFLHGEAMDLFRERFGEEHGFNVHSWVRLLQSEIARKNNYPSDKITGVPDLISRKCIKRDFVDDSLSLIVERARPPLDMALVNTELGRAGWSSVDLMRLSKRLPNATADYTDATNIEATDLVKNLETLFACDSEPKLHKFIAEAEKSVLPLLSGPYRDRIYLAAMCILVFYEKI